MRRGTSAAALDGRPAAAGARAALKPTHLRSTKSTNVRLQSVLYFNSIFSLVFFAMMCTTILHRMQAVDDLKPEFVFGVSIAFGVWSLVEVARLAFGYFGNLGESVRSRVVAELSACLLLTLFPQVPIVAFICFVNPASVPSDLACGVIMTVFIAVEVPTCFRTLRGIVDRRKAEFYEQCANEESAGAGAGGAAHAEEGVTLLSRPQLPSPVRNRTPRDTLPTVSRSRQRANVPDRAGEAPGVELASSRRLRDRLARRRAAAESRGSDSDGGAGEDREDTGANSPLLRRGRAGDGAGGESDSGSDQDASPSPSRSRSSISDRLRRRRQQRAPR